MKDNLSEIFGSLAYGMLILLMFWGYYHSFTRHGLITGIIAVAIPPYALYEGVASIWEEPAWKDNYYEGSQLIVHIIYTTQDIGEDLELRTKIVNQKRRLNEWVKELPNEERTKLRRASKAFGDAFTAYAISYFNSMQRGFTENPEESYSVIRHIDDFKHIQSFIDYWEETKINREMDFQLLKVKVENLDSYSREEMIAAIGSSYGFLSIASEGIEKKIDFILNEIFE